MAGTDDDMAGVFGVCVRPLNGAAGPMNAGGDGSEVTGVGGGRCGAGAVGAEDRCEDDGVDVSAEAGCADDGMLVGEGVGSARSGGVAPAFQHSHHS